MYGETCEEGELAGQSGEGEVERVRAGSPGLVVDWEHNDTVAEVRQGQLRAGDVARRVVGEQVHWSSSTHAPFLVHEHIHLGRKVGGREEGRNMQ